MDYHYAPEFDGPLNKDRRTRVHAGFIEDRLWPWTWCGMWRGGEARGRGVLSAYIIEVYKDVQKIWGGFFNSNYEYGCSNQARIINI